ARAGRRRGGHVERRVTDQHRRRPGEVRAVPAGGVAPGQVHQFGPDLVRLAVGAGLQVEVAVQAERAELHLGHRPDIPGEHRLHHAHAGAGVDGAGATRSGAAVAGGGGGGGGGGVGGGSGAGVPVGEGAARGGADVPAGGRVGIPVGGRADVPAGGGAAVPVGGGGEGGQRVQRRRGPRQRAAVLDRQLMPGGRQCGQLGQELLQVLVRLRGFGPRQGLARDGRGGSRRPR